MTGAGKQGRGRSVSCFYEYKIKRQNNNYKEHSSINAAEEKLVILSMGSCA